MPIKIFFPGMILGRLTLLEEEKRGAKNYWKVKCQCGDICSYRTDYFKKMKDKGLKFECEKCKEKRRYDALIDKKIGRLTILKYLGVLNGDSTLWVRCDCGLEKQLAAVYITRKNKSVKSCGCLARKLHSKWVNTTQYPPAHGFKKKEADFKKTKLYRIRNRFCKSCYDPKCVTYKTHGEKGHIVCDLWRNGAKDFVEWGLKNGYENNFGLYLNPGATVFSPENCYFEDRKTFTQRHNSTFIEYKGESKSISDWERTLGFKKGALNHRIIGYKGVPLEKIMNPQFFINPKNCGNRKQK